MFERSTAWSGLQRDERRVRQGFWPKAKRIAATLPFAHDLLSAYYCAFDRQTPAQAKAALIGALAYFVLPVDAVPDILPMLGYTDDALVLVAALRMVSSHIRDEHREAARQALARNLDDVG